MPANEGGDDDLLDSQAYSDITKRSQLFISIEVGLTAFLALCVYLHLQAPLWDQFYLEQVLADWRRGPIVQLRTLAPDATCDSDSMAFQDDMVDFNDKYGTSADQFELVGQGYFWGLRAGCVCQKGKYLQYDTRQCTGEMRMDGVCKDTTKMNPRFLPIANKVKLCARRDNDLSFLKSSRPVKEKGQWVCKDEKHTQLCGDSKVGSEADGKLVCIRAGSRCPVTQLSFSGKADGSLTVETSHDARLGSPLVSLRLSEGGAPCAKEGDIHSIQDGKQKHTLMPNVYYQQCPEVSIGSMNFKHSKLYTPVSGYPETNEWDLLFQNKETSEGSAPYSNMQLLSERGWDKARQKKYLLKLYEKHYLRWSDSCAYTADGQTSEEAPAENTKPGKEKAPAPIAGQEIKITPKDLVPIIESASYLESTVFCVYWLLIIMFLFGLVELAANFMHREDALGKGGQDKIVLFRRLIANVLLVLVFYLYSQVYAWKGHAAVKAITENDCSNDEVLALTFKEMDAYLQEVKSGWFKWFMLLIMIVITLLTIGGFLFKLSAEKKLFNGSQNVGSSELPTTSQPKDKQLKEKLIEKQ